LPQLNDGKAAPPERMRVGDGRSPAADVV